MKWFRKSNLVAQLFSQNLTYKLWNADPGLQCTQSVLAAAQVSELAAFLGHPLGLLAILWPGMEMYCKRTECSSVGTEANSAHVFHSSCPQMGFKLLFEYLLGNKNRQLLLPFCAMFRDLLLFSTKSGSEPPKPSWDFSPPLSAPLFPIYICLHDPHSVNSVAFSCPFLLR